MTHTYTRHGTTNLFATLEVTSGSYYCGALPPAPPSRIPAFLEYHRRRRARIVEFGPDMRQLRHPQNLCHPPVAAAPPQFHLHFTPPVAFGWTSSNAGSLS
jgi:hypothetical protein